VRKQARAPHCLCAHPHAQPPPCTRTPQGVAASSFKGNHSGHSPVAMPGCSLVPPLAAAGPSQPSAGSPCKLSQPRRLPVPVPGAPGSGPCAGPSVPRGTRQCSRWPVGGLVLLWRGPANTHSRRPGAAGGAAAAPAPTLPGFGGGGCRPPPPSHPAAHSPSRQARLATALPSRPSPPQHQAQHLVHLRRGACAVTPLPGGGRVRAQQQPWPAAQPAAAPWHPTCILGSSTART
jgi:hypothetical protein